MVRTKITASTASDEEELLSSVSPDVVFTVVMERVVVVLESDMGKKFLQALVYFLPFLSHFSSTHIFATKK